MKRTLARVFAHALGAVRWVVRCGGVVLLVVPFGLWGTEEQVINGVRYTCEEGICRPVEALAVDAFLPASVGSSSLAQGTSPVDSLLASRGTPRVVHGYLEREEFLAFLRGSPADEVTNRFQHQAWWVVLGLILLGGLAMNLTPCVLPMLPITLLVIGRSARRGLWYALGIVLTYGTLGVVAATGGLVFGELQGQAWFNGVIAALFLLLALALSGLFPIDFSKWRPQVSRPQTGVAQSFFALGMGAVGALLAGACVAPILIAVLVLTVDLAAAGNRLAFLLPFVLGLGLALPWPFAAMGLKVLPQPGAWMRRVNQGFALVVFAFAAWYGFLAWQGLTARKNFVFSPTESLALQADPRPVLVDCWASWCKNCTAMEQTTLQLAEVCEELKNFRVFRLQAEDLSLLRQRPGFEGVKGLPAYLIFPALKQAHAETSAQAK